METCTMFGENGNSAEHGFGVPETDAESAYTAAHGEARDLLTRIEELLCELPAPGSEDRPIDWSTVGCVYEVNRQLGEVVSFLGTTV
jgi:hypothetical protein